MITPQDIIAIPILLLGLTIGINGLINKKYQHTFFGAGLVFIAASVSSFKIIFLVLAIIFIVISLAKPIENKKVKKRK